MIYSCSSPEDLFSSAGLPLRASVGFLVYPALHEKRRLDIVFHAEFACYACNCLIPIKEMYLVQQTQAARWIIIWWYLSTLIWQVQPKFNHGNILCSVSCNCSRPPLKKINLWDKTHPKCSSATWGNVQLILLLFLPIVRFLKLLRYFEALQKWQSWTLVGCRCSRCLIKAK